MLLYEHDGARLSERRERRGLTREEVAARSGISCDHLTLLEWGFLPPSRSDLERLEAALGDVPESPSRPNRHAARRDSRRSERHAPAIMRPSRREG
jgi:transcriptional regulator with XRE-family HTH domain